MFKFTKRVLSLIFASVLLLNLLQTNAYAEDTVVTEEKVACKATLDDAFADNRVMVVLDNETSLAVDQFSTSMFSGISCKKSAKPDYIERSQGAGEDERHHR